MLSVAVFRNAAALSVRRTAGISAVARRAYTTDKETPKEEEAPKVEVELSEEVKKMLAEKDKQISELKVRRV